METDCEVDIRFEALAVVLDCLKGIPKEVWTLSYRQSGAIVFWSREGKNQNKLNKRNLNED